MSPIPARFRRQVRSLVEEAREKGPRQSWKVSAKPVVPDSRKGRFCYSAAEFRQDPKQLWADEITQTYAEGAMEAFDQGFVEIAFLRARTAADWEAKHCTPGIYQRLFALIAGLAEELGREKEKKPMSEAEQLKAIKDKLHDIAGEAFNLRRYKIAKVLIGAIENINAEINPKGEQMPLDLEKK